MWDLVGIGLLAGLITAVSPCVLPVLPIILAGGATGRKPLRIIAGLVSSFVVFTLFATWLLDKLGCRRTCCATSRSRCSRDGGDTRRRRSASLERPFARQRVFGQVAEASLGASLGLVFVPCAAGAATVMQRRAKQVRLLDDRHLIAYAIGAAIPMLAIAVGGSGVSRRLRSGAQLRFASGVVMAAVALASSSISTIA